MCVCKTAICKAIKSTIVQISFCLAVTLALPGPAPASLPPPLPYAVEGVYHLDRWGQHRYGDHFIFPDLADGLKPLQGADLRLTVTKRILDLDWQPWIILDYKNAGKVATPYAMILSFLEPRAPLSAADQKQMAEWIDQLGSDKYAIRQKAEQGLIQMGTAALPALRKALKHPTLEVTLRAQRCIDAIGNVPDLALPAHVLHGVAPTEPVHLKVTISNRSGQDLPAAPIAFTLRHTTRYPFRPTGRHAYLPETRPPEKELPLLEELKIKRTFVFYQDEHTALKPQQQKVEWHDPGHKLWDKTGALPPLKKGQAVVWTVTVHKPWDAEAELTARLNCDYQDKNSRITSNTLRLDVTGDKRVHDQPLRIEIGQPKKPVAKPGQPIPVQIVFTNTGKKPVVFDLPYQNAEPEGRFVTFDHLFAYDVGGTLLRGENPGQTYCYHVFKLKPGQSATIAATIPPGTVCGRFVLPGVASGGVRLDNNGGPQIYLDDPHGSLSPLTRIDGPPQNSGKDKE